MTTACLGAPRPLSHTNPRSQPKIALKPPFSDRSHFSGHFLGQVAVFCPIPATQVTEQTPKSATWSVHELWVPKLNFQSIEMKE